MGWPGPSQHIVLLLGSVVSNQSRDLFFEDPHFGPSSGLKPLEVTPASLPCS